MAKLANVSIRALHHYDEMGLLKPSKRSAAGYRLYSEDDLDRLQQVLFYKELGFGLDKIGELMADPDFDRGKALIAQRELMAKQATRLQAMVKLIDKTLVSIEGGIDMKKEEKFEGFEAEAKERWGETDSYKESARRTKNYTEEDWSRIEMEDETRIAKMVDLFDRQVGAEEPGAMDLAEEARLSIDKNFYPCSHEMHLRLGEMYVADQRFTDFYDKHRQGLAKWFNAAIKANAARAARENE